MVAQLQTLVAGTASQDAKPGYVASPDETELGKWFQPGADSGKYYEHALRRCKEVNKDLQLGSFDVEKGDVGTMILRMTPIRIPKPKVFTADMVQKFVESEQARILHGIDSKAPWRKTVSELGYTIGDVATKLKPVIDLFNVFMPQSPEYTVPYGCLMIIFQGAAKKKEKKEAAFATLKSLSDDLPIFDFYQILWPTDEIRKTVAMLYMHILDLLHRLAKYFDLGSLFRLWDALFPRSKFALSQYSSNIKTRAVQLEKLCIAAHNAETRSISTDLKEFRKEAQAALTANASELQSMRQRLESLENDQKVSDNAAARYRVSELFEVWDSQVGAVEDELHLWQKPRFLTDPRDHWSHNGVLPCIVNWRELSFNSILWVSSESSSRQSWMTEFALDLIRVTRSNQQMTTFALCDRPHGVRWTPEVLMKQLICQLLHLNPLLAIEEPELFDSRVFRRARSFSSAIHLLGSIIARLESVQVVIDRIDLCQKDPDSPGDQNLVQALCKLTKTFPKSLRTIVTSGGKANAEELFRLGISVAIINTRRRPHRR